MGFGVCLVIAALILVLGYIIVKAGGAVVGFITYVASELQGGHPSLIAIVAMAFFLSLCIAFIVSVLKYFGNRGYFDK